VVARLTPVTVTVTVVAVGALIVVTVVAVGSYLVMGSYLVVGIPSDRLRRDSTSPGSFAPVRGSCSSLTGRR
jgi:hypothetical protein